MKSRDLILGAEKIIKNADDMFFAAKSLVKKNPTIAYFLFQIATEECAKIELLGWHHTANHFTGQLIDWNIIGKSFISHKYKNYVNAYFEPPSKLELKNRKNGKVFESLKEFRQLQNDFHVKKNNLKNASLYVSINKKGFVSPQDVISSKDVKNIEKEAAKHMLIASASVRRMQTLEKYELKNKLTHKEFEVEVIKLVKQVFGKDFSTF